MTDEVVMFALFFGMWVLLAVRAIEPREVTLRMRYQRSDGEVLPPWYYGFAYLNACYGVEYYYPMPINWIVRIWRWTKWQWDKMRSR